MYIVHQGRYGNWPPLYLTVVKAAIPQGHQEYRQHPGPPGANGYDHPAVVMFPGLVTFPPLILLFPSTLSVNLTSDYAAPVPDPLGDVCQQPCL